VVVGKPFVRILAANPLELFEGKIESTLVCAAGQLQESGIQPDHSKSYVAHTNGCGDVSRDDPFGDGCVQALVSTPVDESREGGV
jgi:hypothetical protein